MTLREQYDKEVKRIYRGLAGALKRGFRIPEGIEDLGKYLKIPEPKRIRRETVEKVKTISVKNLYNKLQYITETGKVVSGKKGREIERIKAGKKGAETRKRRKKEEEEYYNKSFDYVIDDFLPNEGIEVIHRIREMIENWLPSDKWTKQGKGRSLEDIKRADLQKMLNILDGAIDRDGINVVARRAQMYSTSIYDILNMIMFSSGNSAVIYGRDGVNRDLVLFANILNGESISIGDRLIIEKDLEEYE